jgi:hypothetical protein
MKTAPKNLSQVRNALCDMYAEVMNDRRMSVQVTEGANALGKVIGSCKVHLEACKISGTKMEGEWKEFIMGDTTPKPTK